MHITICEILPRDLLSHTWSATINNQNVKNCDETEAKNANDADVIIINVWTKVVCAGGKTPDYYRVKSDVFLPQGNTNTIVLQITVK